MKSTRTLCSVLAAAVAIGLAVALWQVRNASRGPAGSSVHTADGPDEGATPPADATQARRVLPSPDSVDFVSPSDGRRHDGTPVEKDTTADVGPEDAPRTYETAPAGRKETSPADTTAKLPAASVADGRDLPLPRTPARISPTDAAHPVEDAPEPEEEKRRLHTALSRVLSVDTVKAILNSNAPEDLPEHWVEEPYPETALTNADGPSRESAADFVETTMQAEPDVLEVGLIVNFDSESHSPPNAFVIGQELPRGWKIAGSDPAVSLWDSQSRTAKWLFMGKDVSNRVITVVLSRESETAADPRLTGRSWLRYRLPDGSYYDTPPDRRVTMASP